MNGLSKSILISGDPVLSGITHSHVDTDHEAHFWEALGKKSK